MSLKKNDKIIAIVGVLILVIAGIGIVLYTPSDDDGAPTDGEGDDLNIYNVKTDIKPGDEEKLSMDMKKPKPLSIMKNGKIYQNGQFLVLEDTNVDSVFIEVVYNDQQKGPIFIGWIFDKVLKKPIGEDSLKVTITTPDEQKYVLTVAGNGKDNVTIMVLKDFEIPDTVEATSEEEAQRMLDENYSGNNWIGLNFKVSAQLTINGKLLPGARLKELLGSDVATLKYTCYTYTLTPEETNGDEDPNGGGDGDGDEEKETGVLTYSPMSMGGRQ